MDTAEKLSMSLDDIGGGGRGGRRGGRPPPRRDNSRGGASRGRVTDDDFTPYRNTGGRTHLAGASLQEIAAASDGERCVRVASRRGARTVCAARDSLTRANALATRSRHSAPPQRAQSGRLYQRQEDGGACAPRWRPLRCSAGAHAQLRRAVVNQ
jgi:hypothetical protein